MLWLPESPMFLLFKDRKAETLEVLRKVYSLNTGRKPHTYPVSPLNAHIYFITFNTFVLPLSLGDVTMGR